MTEAAVIEQVWQEFADLGPFERRLIADDAPDPENDGR
jgi:hypothetical protein